MGLRTLKNKKGLYKLTNTIANENLHDEPWITEEKAKAILIEDAHFEFLKKVMEIDMEFPNGYGSLKEGRLFDKEKHGKVYKWFNENYYDNDTNPVELLCEKIKEITKRLDVDISLEVI